jgi:hypothetical protein
MTMPDGWIGTGSKQVMMRIARGGCECTVSKPNQQRPQNTESIALPPARNLRMCSLTKPTAVDKETDEFEITTSREP